MLPSKNIGFLQLKYTPLIKGSWACRLRCYDYEAERTIILHRVNVYDVTIYLIPPVLIHI